MKILPCVSEIPQLRQRLAERGQLLRRPGEQAAEVDRALALSKVFEQEGLAHPAPAIDDHEMGARLAQDLVKLFELALAVDPGDDGIERLAPVVQGPCAGIVVGADDDRTHAVDGAAVVTVIVWLALLAVTLLVTRVAAL